MSQPQLTSFFTQAKRGTRNAKSVKNENTNVDIQSKRITRSKRIAETVSGNDDYESSKSLLLNSGEKKTALPNLNTIRKLETKSKENVLGEESPSVPLIQDSLIRCEAPLVLRTLYYGNMPRVCNYSCRRPT